MDLITRSNNYFLDNMFEDFFKLKHVNDFKCDIYEQDNKYYIELDIPGCDKDNVTIEYDNGYLMISVLKEEDNIDDSRNYIRRERKRSDFNRSFYVGDIEAENINATFKNGSLIITVPKEEHTKTKKTILIEEK